MRLRLLDWSGLKRGTPVDFEHLENVESILIEVITGDEIATITYKDGTVKKFDSSETRTKDFYDYKYILYSKKKNRIKSFLNRRDSYTMGRFAE